MPCMLLYGRHSFGLDLGISPRFHLAFGDDLEMGYGFLLPGATEETPRSLVESAPTTKPANLPIHCEKLPAPKPKKVDVSPKSSRLQYDAVAFDIGDEPKRYYVRTETLCKQSRALAKILSPVMHTQKRKIILKHVNMKTFMRLIQFIDQGRYEVPKACHVDFKGKINDWLESSVSTSSYAWNTDGPSCEKGLKLPRQSPRVPGFWEYVRISRLGSPPPTNPKAAYILRWNKTERVIVYDEVDSLDKLSLDFSDVLSAHSEVYYLALRLGLVKLQKMALMHIAYTFLVILPLLKDSSVARESVLRFVREIFLREDQLHSKDALKLICARFWVLFEPHLKGDLDQLKKAADMRSIREYSSIYSEDLTLIRTAMEEQIKSCCLANSSSCGSQRAGLFERYKSAVSKIPKGSISDTLSGLTSRRQRIHDFLLSSIESGKKVIANLEGSDWNPRRWSLSQREGDLFKSDEIGVGGDGADELFGTQAPMGPQDRAGVSINSMELALQEEIAKLLDFSVQELCGMDSDFEV